MKQENLSEFLEYLAKSLVDNPEEVSVESYMSGNTVHLDLRVGPEDIGRIIGKHGRVANSLRTLLKVAAARNGKQVAMDVIDNN